MRLLPDWERGNFQGGGRWFPKMHGGVTGEDAAFIKVRTGFHGSGVIR